MTRALQALALGLALIVGVSPAYAGMDPVARGMAAQAARRGVPLECSSVATLCLNLTNGGSTVFSVDKTGNIVAGGATVTTSTPVLSLSQTWSSSGTTFVGAQIAITDTASATASLPFQITVGGTSIFNIRKDGAVSGNNSFTIGSTARTSLQDSRISMGSTAHLSWTTGTNSFGTEDVVFSRLGAGAVQLSNNGAGGQPVVAGLPTCNSAAKGGQAMVTDATATTFASAVVGSGANTVPVYCDGTSWKIG